MYSLEHNNMTAAPVIKGNTSGFLPTGASLSISKWRLREIGEIGVLAKFHISRPYGLGCTLRFTAVA